VIKIADGAPTRTPVTGGSTHPAQPDQGQVVGQMDLVAELQQLLLEELEAEPGRIRSTSLRLGQLPQAFRT